MTEATFPGPLLVMGAGSVGCYLGGRLAAAGVEVTFVGRPRVLAALGEHGLTLSDLDGAHRHLPAAALRLSPSIPAVSAPSLVLLTVKSGATAQAATELEAALPAGTLVLSMQNGIDNAEIAQAAAPNLHVLAGMVPYNVAEVAAGHFRRGTTGDLAAADDPRLRPWLDAFAAAGMPLKLHADLRPVQWGKLLLNLNNPVNALSGRPLRDELLQRGYRRCLAALMEETLVVLAAAGISPTRAAAVAPQRLPTLLRLPTPLFRLVAARMLRIDPQARSSMADDLRHGRVTEIDALSGAVVRLARAHGRDAPLNRKMIALLSGEPASIKTLTAPQLVAALGL